ncbi:MAG: hypothetical protein ACKO6N_24120 [Myxococcota bacterium]
MSNSSHIRAMGSASQPSSSRPRSSSAGGSGAGAPGQTQASVIDARAHFSARAEAARAEAARAEAARAQGARAQGAPLRVPRPSASGEAAENAPQGSGMAAVNSKGIDFGAGPPEAQVLSQTLQGPVRLLGQAMGLWYWVKTESLQPYVYAPLFSVGGRTLFGLCAGRFIPLQEPESDDPLAHWSLERRISEGEALVELTQVALMSTPHGPTFTQVGRMVDASVRTPLLKVLAHKRPRELAYMQLTRERDRWRMGVNPQNSKEELVMEVQERSWLNRLGVGGLMAGGLKLVHAQVPLGGGAATFLPGTQTRLRMGRLLDLRIPERLHLGLLNPETLLSPDAVTILPSMEVDVCQILRR